MKRKVLRSLITLAGISCCSLALLCTPVTTMPVKAAMPPIASPQKDIIRYRFKIEDGKLYKRLYNYSNGDWESDWIYVCDWEE